MDKENLQFRYGCIFCVIFLVVYILSFPSSDFGILGWVAVLLIMPMLLSVITTIGFIVGSIHHKIKSLFDEKEKLRKIHGALNAKPPNEKGIELPSKSNIVKCSFCGKDLSNVERDKIYLGYCCYDHYYESELISYSKNETCEWCGKAIERSTCCKIDNNFCCDQCYFDWLCCNDSDD